MTATTNTAAALPAITEQVVLELGTGIVVAYLCWPDHHPTHAGRVAALVIGDGFEGLAYPGQARAHRPEPVEEPPSQLPSTPVLAEPPTPPPSQPTLF